MKYSTQLIMIVFSLTVFSAFAHEPLNGTQLYLLMKASSQRYQSIEAEIENTSFQFQADSATRQVQYFRKLVYKKNTTQEYYDSTRYDVSGPERLFQGQTIWYNTKGVFTAATLSTDNSAWRVMIEKSQNRDNDLLFTGILDILWETCGFGLDALKTRFENAPVAFDLDTECYILTIYFGSSVGMGTPFQLWIDPGKDYITAKTETYLPDGNHYVRNECREFEMINGLWVPIRYTWIDPSAQYGGDYNVVSILVNAEKTPENYFKFPENARVVDKIRGVEYRIRKEDISKEASVPVNSVPPAKLLSPPAADVELAEASNRAQELLEQLKPVSSGVVQIVPIELVPCYVWVLPGKNEYTLSIRSDGENTSLVRHTFEPEGLVMHELVDNIAAEGIIKVLLERPAEQKTFADGILTLEFADQTKTVHFVAAPR